MNARKSLPFLALLGLLFCVPIHAQSELVGRWDLEVQYGEQWLPSWLEVEQSGTKALVGHYVSISGSARPVAEVRYKEGFFSFSIPPQWNGTQDMFLVGSVENDGIKGNILDHTGATHAFRGKRAPELLHPAPEKWSEPQSLIADNSLAGWVAVPAASANQWVVQDGVLKSPASGANLRTEAVFSDFKLHVEFRIPEGSNSGVYLRGRYEVQVEDSYGKAPNSHFLGGIYGFLTPSENAAKKPGEWQTYDITLVGRRVTVVANGTPIIVNQIIPGITGGALDSNEGAPGPILLQGDHGPVEYRNMTLSVPGE